MPGPRPLGSGAVRGAFAVFVGRLLEAVSRAINSHVMPDDEEAGALLHSRVCDLLDAVDAWKVVGSAAAVGASGITRAPGELSAAWEELHDEAEGARAVLREVRPAQDADAPLSVLAELVVGDLRAALSGQAWERDQGAREVERLRLGREDARRSAREAEQACVAESGRLQAAWLRSEDLARELAKVRAERDALARSVATYESAARGVR